MIDDVLNTSNPCMEYLLLCNYVSWSKRTAQKAKTYVKAIASYLLHYMMQLNNTLQATKPLILLALLDHYGNTIQQVIIYVGCPG